MFGREKYFFGLTQFWEELELTANFFEIKKDRLMRKFDENGEIKTVHTKMAQTVSKFAQLAKLSKLITKV